jgi:L-malate glycosyltransferase
MKTLRSRAVRIFQVLEKNRFDTGSVQQMFQAASGLRARGHDVTIVSRPDATLAAKAAQHDLRFRALPLRNQFDVLSMIAMRRLIRQLEPEVIHVHKGIAHAIALVAVTGMPVGALVVNRGVSFPLDRWNRGKYRTSRVDRIVTVCQQIKDVMVASGKLPPQKIEVVYAGTDLAVFNPEKEDAQSFRREKTIPNDRFLIGQVGIRDWKGWKELIDAVATLAALHPNIHLALIGYRNESVANDVRNYAAAKGVATRVTPVEYRTDMPNVFASCDLVVDASWAGTGITGTVREAMAMAKPVVATDAGGNRELVSSPDVGWLIPMRDQNALTGAIAAVIRDPARASVIGRNARQHVMKGFSRELRISRLETVYEEILDSKRAR